MFSWQRFSLRSLLQFRLATLLILVTIAGCVMGLWRVLVAPYQHQAVAVKQIVSLGGVVHADGNVPSWLGWFVEKEHCRRIVTVQLEGCRVTNQQLDGVRDLPWLKNLYLARNPIDDDGILVLARFPKLERVSLWKTRITNAGLAKLPPLPNLSVLDISQTQITDEGLAHLTKQPALHSLLLGGRITDEGLRHIPNMKSLRSLDITLTWATPAGLMHLRDTKLTDFGPSRWQLAVSPEELAHLRSLDRKPFPIGIQEHVSEISKANASHTAGFDQQLKSFQLRGQLETIRATPAEWQSLWRSQAKSSLTILECHLTDEGLMGIADSSLFTLELRDVPIGDAGLLEISRMKKLHRLVLASTNDACGFMVSEQGLLPLKNLTSVKHLDVRGLPVSPRVLAEWKSLQQIRHLTLGGLHVDDDVVAQLEPFSNLFRLNLEGAKITDASVPHILRIRSLRSADVRRTGMSDKAQQQIWEALKMRRS